ncbi:MAG: hypothetical protein AB7J32_22965 [Pseudonocardia sp.]
MHSRRVLFAALAAAVSVLFAVVLVAVAQAAEPTVPEPVAQGEKSTFPEVPFTVTNDATGLCLAGKAPAAGERTGLVVVEACDTGSGQRWTYDVVSKRLRTEKLGVRWCLSAEGPVMVRCPDLRSDTYRWLQGDGIYTPGNGNRAYLGVQADSNDVLVAAPDVAGRGFDWTVAPVEQPQAAATSAPAPTSAEPPAPAAAPLPVAPPGADALPTPAPGALPLPTPGDLPLPAPGALPLPAP